jgi:hypothetical protein
LREQLHGRQASFGWLEHAVKIGRRVMAGTPNGCSHDAALILKPHDIDRVAPTTLHRGDIEAKQIFCLLSTSNVEMSVAIWLMTFYRGQAALLADFADWFESFHRDKTDTFGIVK